jgi:hypothetical protein
MTEHSPSKRGKAEYVVEIVEWVNGRRTVAWVGHKAPLVSGKNFARRMTRKEANACAAAWNSPRWGCKPKSKASAVKDDPPAQEAALRCPTGEAA